MRSFNLPEFKENEQPAVGAVVIPMTQHHDEVLIKAMPYMIDSLSGWQYKSGTANSNSPSTSGPHTRSKPSPVQSQSSKWINQERSR